MTTAIQEKIDERVKLVEQAGAFLNECESNGGMSADQDAQWQKMHSDADALKAEIETLEAAEQTRKDRVARQAAAEEELSRRKKDEGLDHIRNIGGVFRDVRQEERQQRQPMNRLQAIDTVLNAWSEGGRNGVERGGDELAEAFKASGCEWDTKEGGITVSLMNSAPSTIDQLMAAQSVGTDAAGGYTVPEGFLPNLERALLDYGGVRQAATILRTATGNSLPMPDMNDTGNTGALLAENTQDTEQDITFGVTTLDAYKYTSKIIRVSKELEQDSAFNIGTEIGSAAGIRLGRIFNTHGTTGTGSSQPNGIVTASTAGKTAASATAITHDELLDLKHSVDPAYRRGGMSSWMFNDATLLALKKLKDADNRPLWQAGIAVGDPDRLDGDTFIINQDMASIATGNKTVLYGCLSKFYCREVLGVTLVRMVERYADFHQTGYVAIMRFDADLRDAGTNPVKHLVQA